MLYENDNTNDRKGNAFTIKILTNFFSILVEKISRGKKKHTNRTDLVGLCSLSCAMKLMSLTGCFSLNFEIIDQYKLFAFPSYEIPRICLSFFYFLAINSLQKKRDYQLKPEFCFPNVCDILCALFGQKTTDLYRSHLNS